MKLSETINRDIRTIRARGFKPAEGTDNAWMSRMAQALVALENLYEKHRPVFDGCDTLRGTLSDAVISLAMSVVAFSHTANSRVNSYLSSLRSVEASLLIFTFLPNDVMEHIEERIKTAKAIPMEKSEDKIARAISDAVLEVATRRATYETA